MSRTTLTVIFGAAIVAVTKPALADVPFPIPPGRLASLTTLALRRPVQPTTDRYELTKLRLPALTVEPGLSKNRMAVWGGTNVAAGYFAYEQSQSSWGVSSGHFHIKDDLHDGLAMSDETSHLFAAYHLTHLLKAGYAWTGMSSDAAPRAAAAHAWLWTFLVEYPIDAYNPTQGFGASDLVFNTVGVVAGYVHTRPGSTPWWDIKLSIKSSFFKGENRFIAHTNEQYDDYVYWLTVRPYRHRHVPIWLGAGYSTTHRQWPQLDKELHLGIGTTVSDVAAVFDRGAAKYLQPLDFFYLNLGTKIVWR